MLTLAEDLALFGITEKGDVAASASLKLDNGLAGAQLMDLALHGRIRLDGDSLVVVDPAPTGAAALDAVLDALVADERPRTAREWIGRIAGRDARAPVVERLRERGILREQRSKVLGVFPRTRNLEVDPEPEREARGRLRAVLVEDRSLDAQTAALASLVAATDLVAEVFPDQEDREAAQARLDALTRGDVLRGALGAANEATLNAVMTSVLLAVAGSVTAATSVAVINP